VITSQPTYRLTNALGVPQTLTGLQLDLDPGVIGWFNAGDTFTARVTAPGGAEQSLTVQAAIPVPGTMVLRDQGSVESPALALVVAPGQAVTVVFEVDPSAVIEDPSAANVTVHTGVSVPDGGPQTPYPQAAWQLQTEVIGTDGALIPALRLSVASTVAAAAGRRELKPELLPGYAAAAPGDMPSKSAEGGLNWGPAEAGGSAAGALTSLPNWELDSDPDWREVGFGGWDGFDWDTMQYGDSIYSYGHDADGVLTGGGRVGVKFTLTESLNVPQLRFYCDTYEYPTAPDLGRQVLAGLRAVVLDAQGAVRIDTRFGTMKFGEYGYSTPAEKYAQFVQWDSLANPANPSGWGARITLEPGQYELIVYHAGGAIDPFLQQADVFEARGLTVQETRWGEFDGGHDVAQTPMTDADSSVVPGYHLMFALGWMTQPVRTYNLTENFMEEEMPLGLTYDHRIGRVSFESDGDVVDVLGQRVYPGTEPLIGNRRRAMLSATPHARLLAPAPVQQDLGLQTAVAISLSPNRPITLGALEISASMADEIRTALAAHPDLGSNYCGYMTLQATLYDITNALSTRQNGFLLDDHGELKLGAASVTLTNYLGQPVEAGAAMGEPITLTLPRPGFPARDLWLAEDRQYVLGLHVVAPYLSGTDRQEPAFIPLRVGNRGAEQYAPGHGYLLPEPNFGLAATSAKARLDGELTLVHAPTWQWIAGSDVTLLVGGSGGRDVYGRLSPDAFPAAATDDEIPNEGVARVGLALRYRDVDGEMHTLGGGEATVTPTQEQVNAAVTQAQIEAAVSAAEIEAAVRKQINAGQAVTIEGLTYALPNAQTLDAPAVDSLTAALTSSRVSMGSNSYDLTYVSRDLTHPFDPVVSKPYTSLGTTQKYRFGTAVNEQDASAGAVSMALSGSHGKVVRQEFAFSAPVTTSSVLLKWAQAAGAGGYVEDCVYTIRLYGPGNALIKTWANVNLRGMVVAGETSHALDAETVLTSGALEIEAVSLFPTTKVGGGSIFYDVNYYPLAATIPVSEQGTRQPATLVGTGTAKNASDEPLALTSPVLRAAPKAVQPSVITTEGAAVRVQTRGQRLHLNLPSMPRPAGKRKFVAVFSPQVRDITQTTSTNIHFVTASLEQLQAGTNLAMTGKVELSRVAGAAQFTLAGVALSAGIRLRLEVTASAPIQDNTHPTTIDYYNDETGVKLYSTTASLPKGTSDPAQLRLVLAPTLANSNIHAMDDLVIHRWTEWTE